MILCPRLLGVGRLCCLVFFTLFSFCFVFFLSSLSSSDPSSHPSYFVHPSITGLNGDTLPLVHFRTRSLLALLQATQCPDCQEKREQTRHRLANSPFEYGVLLEIIAGLFWTFWHVVLVHCLLYFVFVVLDARLHVGRPFASFGTSSFFWSDLV